MITISAKIELSSKTGTTILDINSTNLISFNRQIADRIDYEFPSYGIISNTGNIEFKDIDGQIRKFVEQNVLKEGLKVLVTLNNTLKKTNVQLADFQTCSWDYNNNTRLVSVSLKDDLEEWQEINIEELKLQKPMNAFQIYEYLKSKTPSKWSFDELDSSTKSFLISYLIEYPYLDSGNLWRQWQKLCVVCALHIYKNNEGKVVVIHD